MAQAAQREGEERDEPVYKDHNLHVIFGVTLMAVLGTSSITPAFPEIQDALGISSGQVGLLITVFTLPGILLTPVSGVLSDRYGRQKVLVPSLFLFGTAGVACAFATDFGLLLVLRTLQGVGAASLGALNVTMIGDIYSGQRRTEALGYNSSVLSVGTASYPAIGGALALLGWRYPFALPLVAVPIALLVLFSLRNPEPHNEQDLKEYAGSIWESVRDRRVVGLFCSTLVTFVILFGPLISYLPLFMSATYGSSSLVIGLVLATASLTTALTSTQEGWLTSHFSEKILIRMSFVLYAAALTLIPLVPNVWLLLIPTVIFGVAQSFNLPPVFSLLNEAAPTENRGAFISINSTVLRLGQTLGPVLMSAAATPAGLGGAYVAGAALAATMFLLALILIR
jgi:ACDE family multidrug resistance protein